MRTAAPFFLMLVTVLGGARASGQSTTICSTTATFAREKVDKRHPDASRARFDEVLVKLKSEGVIVRRFENDPTLVVIDVPPGVPSAMVSSIFERARVKDVLIPGEPNRPLRMTQPAASGACSDQWSLGGSAQGGIDAAEAWQIVPDASSAVVAVLDTGVDYNHEDLKGAMYQLDDCDGNAATDDHCFGRNIFTGANDPMDDMTERHGTHVAGIIGAAHNGKGIDGVAPGVKLIGCKMLDAQGNGCTVGAYTCLDYVWSLRKQGVPILAVNASWGGGRGSYSDEVRNVIVNLGIENVLVVAAAGNGAADTSAGLSTAFYPACYADTPNIIAVGASTASRNAKGDSNVGRQTVDLLAPGSGVCSTLAAPNNYGKLGGASMATPHVSGVVAMLAAQVNQRPWWEIRNLVLSGAVQDGSQTVTTGVLDAKNSVLCSDRVVTARLEPRGTVISSVANGSTVHVRVLNIRCGALEPGPLAVTVQPGDESVPLMPDAGQYGTYSGDWIAKPWNSQKTREPHFPDGSVLSTVVL